MRNTAQLLALAALSILASPVSAVEPPPTIRICGRTYSLVHRSQDRVSGSSVAEYAVKGASPATWSSLVTVHELPSSASPESYIRKLSESYAGSHPGMKFSSGSDPSTGEHWMDAIFVASARAGSLSAPAVEWSFFRAVPHPSGTRVLQYSERRLYKKSPDEVFSRWDLSSLRKKLLPDLMRHPVS